LRQAFFVSIQVSSPPAAAHLFLLLQGFAAIGSKTLQQQKLVRTAAGSEDSRRKKT